MLVSTCAWLRDIDAAHGQPLACRRAPPPPTTLVATAGGEIPPKYPPITYSAGATPTKVNVKCCYLGPKYPEIADVLQIQSQERTASPCVRAGKLTPHLQPAEISRAHTILIEEYERYPHGLLSWCPFSNETGQLFTLLYLPTHE